MKTWLLLFVLLNLQEIFGRASDTPCGRSANWINGAQNGFGNGHPSTYTAVQGKCVLTSTKTSLLPGETTTITLTGASQQGLKVETTLGSWSGNNAGIIRGKCVDYDSRTTAPNGIGIITLTAPSAGTVTIKGLCATRSGTMQVSNSLQFIIGTAATFAPTTMAPTVPGGTRTPTTRRPTLAPTQGVPVNNDTTNGGTNNNNVVEISSALFIHIVTMIIGWGILIPVGILIPLFNNIKYSSTSSPMCGLYQTLKYHWVLISIGCIFTFIGTVTGVVEVGVAPDDIHFAFEPHFQLGLVLLIASILHPLHGFFRPNKSKNPTLARKFFDYFHPSLGYIIVLLGVIDNLLGVDVMTRLSTRGAPYMFLGTMGNVGFGAPMGLIILLLSVIVIILLALGLGRAGYNRYLNPKVNNDLALKVIDDDSSMGAGDRKFISMDEVAAHASNQSCWVVYQGKVYDVTAFLNSHPGGKKPILNYAGKDMTKAYDDVGHSRESTKSLQKYYVGELQMGGQRRRSSVSNPRVASQTKKDFFPKIRAPLSTFKNGDTSPAVPPKVKINAILTGSPSTRHRVTLTERAQISPNTFYFKFCFQNQPSKVLGLPTGRHIALHCPKIPGRIPGEWNGVVDVEANQTEISRKYTPVSCDANDIGYFSLVVKIYRPSREYPDGGCMSRYLDLLKLGSQIEISGPFGSHEYVGLGRMLDSGREILFRECAMVCGGSGLTPCIQIATEMLRNKNDRTKIFLIYANSTKVDTLMFEYLKSLEKAHKDRLHIWFTISKATTEFWEYDVGHISERMFKEHLPKGSANVIAITCGPKPMMEVSNTLLKQMGYSEERIIEY